MDSQQLEAFALAKDRGRALEQFIPGTEEHYFHACLLHEQQGDFKEADALLKAWNKAHGESALFREIRNRLNLLRYDKDPKAALEYLRYHLGLSFNHQRTAAGRVTGHPTALDQKAIGRDAIKALGYAHSNASDLSGFTDAALDWVIGEPQDGDRLRSLLHRLQRPDHAGLPELVAAELNDHHSSGFGSIPIHDSMLQEQLDRLRKLVPDLIQSDAFVHAYLTKLQPGPDIDWQEGAPEREAFLSRLWEFVKGLAPRFNPLKAHVLYHRLDHDRRQGIVDRARLFDYLKLPRQVGYANHQYLRKLKGDEQPFGLGQDYLPVTLHAAVGDDEELVRELLSSIFVGAKDFKPFDAWIDERFLKEVFATAKMLGGIGDTEQWYSLINNPSFCQALKERVELGFARTNQRVFRADDKVTLDVDVKNVATLTVKVFEINALNYFLANGRDVDTSIDLDGLVASEEQTVSYDEPPLRRVRRTFSFPSLAAPGVYIVELIGGGISSRALVRKSRLRFLERVGSAGHAFTVLDEDRNILKEASLWLGGREYRAEADGTILVPFSTRPGRQAILLCNGPLATVEAFQHQAESCQLIAGLYVDRESLIKKKEARLVVRPGLHMNGVPVSLALLEEPILTIKSTDRDGVSASLQVRDFALHEDRESVHTFQVPEKLASISFSLRGKMQNLSQSTKVELEGGSAVNVNGIDAEATIEDLHLAHTAAGYVLNHCGKSGEPRAGSALAVTLQHRDLVPAIEVLLQTDAGGRVELGHLRDILSISATTPTGVDESWTLPRDRCRQAETIHIKAGEPFRVPLMPVAPLGAVDYPEAAEDRKLARSEVSLLERIAGTFVRDHFAALSRKDGFLEIAGLPAGDYDLLLKRDGVAITIRAAPGDDRAGWIAGDKRQLERLDSRPLQISTVTVEDDELAVVLGNSSARARVHVFATRYVPAFSSFDQLGRAPSPRAARSVELFKSQSHYVSGRDIGDEYRYILERKQATKFAGNMLARPGLLLNPWAVRGTETATQQAAAGNAYAPSPPPAMSAPHESALEGGDQDGGQEDFANLDFLANPAAVLLNLKPDENGQVRIPRAVVLHANTLRIVAVDARGTACRDVLLPEVRTAHEDLRLRLALDADKHYGEKKQITVLAAGQPLQIADLTTSKTEVYDKLSRVHGLYSTLSNDANLAAFAFILRWQALATEEKQARYSELACHELSFFLSRKDPGFFERVIKPYLRNKLHKTFLDRYLLGDDLSGYVKAWAFHRLNIVERILLAQRNGDEGGPVARHARDLNDLLPRDLERSNHLFASAIQGSALEAGDSLGIARQVAAAELTALSGKPGLASMMMSMSDVRGGAGGAGAPMTMAAMPARAMAGPRQNMAKMKSQARAASADADDAGFSGGDDFGARDREARGRMRQLYQKLDKTQEWAENNYYKLTNEQQGPDLVTINPFWRDYANHRGPGPFLSPHLAHASRNFTEMMFALSVLDLPFEAEQPATLFDGARMTLTAKAVSVAWHKEIKPALPAAERVPVLISQNYFRDDDRTRFENDESVDKYVTGELLINVVYACQVVLTNPTSTNQKLDLLLQIPQGAIPVKNGFTTNGKHVELSSYATESIEYAFYFPAPGTYAHFPAHVAKNEQLIASAPATRLQVVRELSAVDKTSWAWLSQNGSDQEVLAWMDENNLDRLAAPGGGLEQVAWRMRDRGFYEQCIALLARRHIYNDTLCSYGLHHADVPTIREFLQHRDSLVGQCGLWLESPLLTIDPIVRGRYQHLEYAPLVNARTQKLGARRTILNDRLSQQYAQLMDGLRYRASLTDADRLAVSYYLFLQDRVGEALEMFEAVDAEKIESALQYQYLSLYAELFRERPGAAREIALRFQDYPVDRWRKLFQNAFAQLDEISGAGARVVDEKDREERQASLAATEPGFDFSVEKNAVTLHVQNLIAVRVNYYQMDIELLFSRQPFVQQQSGQFSFIKPNRSDEVRLPASKGDLAFDLPAEYLGSNVIVEVVAAGKQKALAHYAHGLDIKLVENYGQLRVSSPDARPLSKTYVKVYSRMKGGEVRFYKDGYTDLRGAFDYTSLNTNELDHVDRFALLILSSEHGAVIREAAPPKR